MIPAAGHPFRPPKRSSYRLEAIALLFAMGAISTLCAWLVWGPDGIWLTVVALGAGALFVPRLAPSMALGMFGAIPMAPDIWPRTFALANSLATRADLTTMPTLFRLPTEVAMAFSTGSRSEPMIAISNGVLERLKEDEIAGLLAHEIAHLATGDIALRTLSELMARLTRILCFFGLFAAIWLALTDQDRVPFAVVLLLAVAPSAIALLQLTLSRNREYEADAYAVEIADGARGLVSALTKLELEQQSLLRRMFWPHVRGEMPVWLRTHPRTEDRIARLRGLRPHEFVG